MRRLGLTILLTFGCALYAADLSVPAHVVAGNAISIPTSGSGEARFYLVGPTHSLQHNVKLGTAVRIEGEDLRDAGRYIAVLQSEGGIERASFFVLPAPPADISFLARPSRVPAAARGVITGTAFVFDKYSNLVLDPTAVKFDLAVQGAPAQARMVQSNDGVAWTRMDSGRKAGAAQFVVSVDQSEVRRVVQQVASDPCNLRLKAVANKTGILVETDPVRDCAGNPVPDGTIVTFIENDGKTRSTIDARIKRGIARAELPAAPNATISAASGVVLGNEVRLGGGR